MAIILKSDQSQILNAGSPVPISGTSDARLMSNQLSNFGETLVKVSAELSNVNTAAKRERARLDSENASNDFNTSLLVLSQKLKESPDYTVVDSDKMLEQYKATAYKNAEDYAQQAGLEGDSRNYFIKNSGDAINQYATQFYASAVSDYSKLNSLKVEKAVASKVQKVLIDSQSVSSTDKNSFTIAKALADSEVILANTNSLTPVEKENLRAVTNKEIALAFTNGKIAAIYNSPSSFERNKIGEDAINFITTSKIATGLFTGRGNDPSSTQEMVDKQIDQIRSAMWQTDSREIQKENQLEALEARNIRQNYKKSFIEMAKDAQLLVKDVPSYNIFRAKIEQKLIDGSLNPADVPKLEKASLPSLMKSGVFSPAFIPDVALDDNYKVKFMEKLLSSKDPMQLVDDPYSSKDVYGSGISAASSLMTVAPRVAERLSKDPLYRTDINEAISSLESVKQNPAFKYMKREESEKINQLIDQARKNVYAFTLDNTEVDSQQIIEFSKKLLDKNIMPSLSKYTPIESKPEIIKKRRQILEEYSAIKKSGKLTKEKEQTYKKRVADLTTQLNSFGKGSK